MQDNRRLLDKIIGVVTFPLSLWRSFSHKLGAATRTTRTLLNPLSLLAVFSGGKEMLNFSNPSEALTRLTQIKAAHHFWVDFDSQSGKAMIRDVIRQVTEHSNWWLLQEKDKGGQHRTGQFNPIARRTAILFIALKDPESLTPDRHESLRVEAQGFIMAERALRQVQGREILIGAEDVAHTTYQQGAIEGDEKFYIAARDLYYRLTVAKLWEADKSKVGKLSEENRILFSNEQPYGLWFNQQIEHAMSLRKTGILISGFEEKIDIRQTAITDTFPEQRRQLVERLQQERQGKRRER